MFLCTGSHLAPFPARLFALEQRSGEYAGPSATEVTEARTAQAKARMIDVMVGSFDF
jgi:hypothetical protein